MIRRGISVDGALGEYIGFPDIFSVLNNFQREQQWIGCVLGKALPKLVILINTTVFFHIFVIELIQRRLILCQFCIAAITQLGIIHCADLVTNPYGQKDLLFRLFVKGHRLDCPLRRVIYEGSILLIETKKLIM